MKVIMLNGSPRKEGCTYTALCEVKKAIEEEGIKCEIIQVTADTDVKEVREKIMNAHGLVVGSPVYYSSPAGGLIDFLDKLFAGSDKNFYGIPAAAVVSARRAGTTASLDVLYKYFSICSMPIVTSRYWCMVHGNTPEEVMQDAEGLCVMRALGKNMAWLVRCINLAKATGLHMPEREEKPATNFIR